MIITIYGLGSHEGHGGSISGWAVTPEEGSTRPGPGMVSPARLLTPGHPFTPDYEVNATKCRLNVAKYRLNVTKYRD